MTFKEELESAKNPAIIKIGDYLAQRAAEDPTIDRTLNKENKSLEECWKYILGEISKKIYREGNFGCAAGEDEELYELALHYYDEDDIKIKPTNFAKVVDRSNKKTKQKEAPKQVSEAPNPKAGTEKPTPKKKKKNDIPDGQLSIFEV